MNKRISKNALLRALLPLLLCCGCGEGVRSGAEWQPPADDTMPPAFAEDENVPDYMRAWRMPEGFQGFTARWNATVQEYIDRQLETQGAELADALNACAVPLPCGAAYTAAQTRALSAAEAVSAFLRRRGEGDYLRYLPEDALPDNLDWQDGADEPEIGDPQALKGGTLRLGLQRSFPNTLRLFGPNSNNATRRYIYDDITLPLVRLHPATGHIIPGTADRWAVSADGRTVFFHIDEAARFSNGSKLTTRDVLTALYVRTSPHGSEPFFADLYKNSYSHITFYGNNTVAVTLSTARPYAPFYAAVSTDCTAFYAEYAPDYATRYQWRVAPTTGGYTVDTDSLVMGHSLTMKRVKDWWAADRKFTRHSCNVDRISYAFITEPSKLRELFRVGEIDVFSARDADFWYEGLEIDPVRRGFIQRVHFSNMWPRNCFGFHLNCSAPPFNDRNMRLGFHHALNIRHVIDTIFRGDFSRAGSYFGGFGKYTDSSIRALPYSPERARAYFARAGYTEEGPDGILCKPDGTRLQLVVSSRIDPLYSNCMNMLREDAAACGLDLRMEQMDDTVFYLKVKERQYSAAIWSWGFTPPLPDASAFFLSSYAYNADGTPITGTNNITGTNSPSLDRAIIAAQTAGTEEEAVPAQHRVQQLIAATAAWVPGWTTTYWRFAQWRWLRWPDTPGCRFCPPIYFDPLDSHLYWVDEKIKEDTLNARRSGGAFPEQEIVIPLPPESQS